MKLTLEYNGVVWRPWQTRVLDLLTGPTDHRKVHWLVDMSGNTGKSYLCTFIAMTRNVIIAEGKKTDVYYQVLQAIEKTRGKVFDAVLLDIPRDGKDFVNYGMIEKIKDGCIYSGKYEGGLAFYPITKVFVFANFEPDFNKWSQDRYDLIYIES